MKDIKETTLATLKDRNGVSRWRVKRIATPEESWYMILTNTGDANYLTWAPHVTKFTSYRNALLALADHVSDY